MHDYPTIPSPVDFSGRHLHSGVSASQLAPSMGIPLHTSNCWKSGSFEDGFLWSLLPVTYCYLSVTWVLPECYLSVTWVLPDSSWFKVLHRKFLVRRLHGLSSQPSVEFLDCFDHRSKQCHHKTLACTSAQSVSSNRPWGSGFFGPLTVNGHYGHANW